MMLPILFTVELWRRESDGAAAHVIYVVCCADVLIVWHRSSPHSDLEDAGKGTDLTASIFKILYATADGFKPADEAEQQTEEQTEEQLKEKEGSAGEDEQQEPEQEAQEVDDDETF